MNFTIHKTKLEALGYVVESDIITTSRGDVMANINPYGEVSCKNEEVEAILNQVADKPVKKEVTKEEVELVRARNKKGQLIGDDSTTPEVNEAWVAKTKKKKSKW